MARPPSGKMDVSESLSVRSTVLIFVLMMVENCSEGMRLCERSSEVTLIAPTALRLTCRSSWANCFRKSRAPPSNPDACDSPLPKASLVTSSPNLSTFAHQEPHCHGRGHARGRRTPSLIALAVKNS
eukprot:6927331-Prymnesium_polylepis.1